MGEAGTRAFSLVLEKMHRSLATLAHSSEPAPILLTSQVLRDAITGTTDTSHSPLRKQAEAPVARPRAQEPLTLTRRRSGHPGFRKARISHGTSADILLGSIRLGSLEARERVR